MSSSEDPQDWTVEELATFLCRDKPGQWSRNLACPDLVALEGCLRENMIAGANFLLFDDHYVKELGIKAIAHRQYLMQAIKWLQRRSPKFQAQEQQEQQAPKALPSEDELPPKLPLDVIDPTTSLDNPVNLTTPDDDATNPNPLHHALSPAQTEGKKPRRMGTTIIERPPSSSLLEPPSPHQQPAPNPTFGNDSFFDHLMKTYPPNDADVLSLLGESSSEGEYDTETREEMEEDERQFHLDAPPDTSGTLRDAEFNEIVDEYINSRKSQFIEIRLPKEQPKGFQIWVSGQKFPSMKNQISTRLAHLEKRCQALRKALAEAQHSSRSSLVQACACLDPTVIDICLDQWKLSVLEKASPPAKIARPPRTPRPEKPSVNSDGEETLSSDLDSVHDPEVEDDESREQSEDDFEESEIAQDEEEPHPRTAYRSGPFHDYSSDEDLSHLFYEEENYEPPATKRRRLDKNSVHQDSSTSPLMPMSTLPFDQDVVMPPKECEGEGQMQSNTSPVSPMRLKTNVSVDSASGNNDETNEAVRVFDDVYSMMWATIEESGNRFHLLAKGLTSLPNNRIAQLSKFLGTYMPSLYREHAREALKNMSEDSSVIEGWDLEESHSAMLMTVLFVSWINVIQVPPGGFTAKQAKAALVAIGGDRDDDQFAPFLQCLNDLLRGYKRWLTLSSRVKSDEMNPAIQRGKRKLIDPTIALTRAQREGKEREEKQAEAKRALLPSPFAQGNAHRENTPQPVSFKTPMICLDPYIAQYVKPHQLTGIQFMFREIIENKRQEGCLLAHTMGLGKTMQVISLLVTISTAGASQDPAICGQIPKELRVSKTLLLCPASLIQNWRDEFALWSPRNHKLGKIRSIPAKNQTVDRTQEICEWNDEGGILILSYNIFRSIVKDKAEKNEEQTHQSITENVKNWVLNSPTLIVVDEAQNLRNHESQIAEAASRLRTRKRIALTGTPISNGLEDYYWMVDWVAPKYLGDFADFNEKFIKPIENGSQIESTWPDRREALRRQELFVRIINPKVQRADMSALASDLPPKYEFSVYFEPTSIQKTVYNLFIGGVKLKNEEAVRPELMSWLPLLKLCCIHPGLFKADLESRKTKHACDKQKGSSSHVPSTDVGLNMSADQQIIPRSILSELDDVFKETPDLLDPSLSNRVTILNEIINQAIAVGDKILVFSSSIPTLKYLSEVMDGTQRKYSVLHGNVPPAQRPEVVRRFNNDPSTSVFLISTKAGGLGLNIQAANRVVIFDFQFNPTWEQQAIGRAYRIGQKKEVFVYRMVAAGTVEEKIYSRAIFKSQLAGRLLDDERVARLGSKTLEKYLVPWQESMHRGGIDQAAFARDPQTMERLKAKCGDSILSIKPCVEEIDPEDSLTAEEQQSIEDELRLRYLRLESS